MSLWEYKIITSGRGGFASPALLEKFLNDLGREEWEIIEFHTQPDNFLVFTGLARRSTQRDWTLEDAAAAAAKAEAEKLRAEFEAKFKAATSTPVADERPASFIEEKAAPDDGFRKPIDTSRDADEDEDEKEEDDWDKLTAAEEDELPTFFDAIKPHMRRNQRGPGMSVGVDYLAKKWDQSEDDLKGALVECGFTIPADEDAKVEYLEFEGDLYWININRRGELWINTKEKPRPVFRPVKAQKAVIEEEAPKPDKHEERRKQEAQRQEERAARNEERNRRSEAAAADAATAPVAEGSPESAASAPAEIPAEELQPLPTGPELLQKIRPLMRRNRRGPGGSGSASFLSRALKVREADLVAAFKSLGLVVPQSANEKPTNVELDGSIWWVNTDSRGNVWINGREKKGGESAAAPAAAAAAENPPSDAPAATAPGEETIKLTVATDVPFSATPEAAPAEAVPAPEIVPAATTEVIVASSAAATEAAITPTAAFATPPESTDTHASEAPTKTDEAEPEGEAEGDAGEPAGEEAEPAGTSEKAPARKRPRRPRAPRKKAE